MSAAGRHSVARVRPVRCGWSSASAFIDVFRRSFGYTPGTHNRRSHQG